METYSIFGNQISSANFYQTIRALTDQVLSEEGLSEQQLLDYLIQNSSKRRVVRRTMASKNPGSRLFRIVMLLHGSLQEYVQGIDEHLKSTPSYKAIRDRELFTIREQYYLYMIEFELVNRIHIRKFLEANYRIALLPYCLRETQEECRAVADRIDYQCTGCRKECYINQLSIILRDKQVEPYIWRNAKLNTLFRSLVKEHGTVGVLGIACIVELLSGMRDCMKSRIPVIGLPLNANRCPRWTGSFKDTSVDLIALESLLSYSA